MAEEGVMFIRLTTVKIASVHKESRCGDEKGTLTVSMM